MGLDADARIIDINRGMVWLKTSKSMASKALFFFMRALDVPRIASICENSTWSCVSAVLDSQDALHIRVALQQPRRVGVRHQIVDKEKENYGTLKESFDGAKNVLAVMGINCYERYVTYPERTDFPCSEAWFLFYYIRIASNALSFFMLDLETVEFESLCDNVFECARGVSFVLKNEVAPLRFWIHLIELAVLLEEQYIQELKRRNGVSGYPTSVLSKELAYLLMVSLDRVSSHYSTGTLSNMATKTEVLGLRKRLLDSWSLAVIQDNAAKAAPRLNMHQPKPATSLDIVPEAVLLITSAFY